jgi:hypothetical protein
MADLPYIETAQEVKITGQDSTGDTVNYVSADANGNLLVKDYADGSVTGGAAATVSTLIGGQYNTVQPTLSTGEQSALQMDAAGELLVNIADREPAFGTVTNASVVLAANTATLLLAANANRRYAYISNPTTKILYIQFGSSTGLSTTQGLVLGEQAGVNVIFEIKGDNLYAGAIYGYSGSAITVSVTEGTP